MIGGFFNNREEMPMEDFSYTIMKLQSLFHRQLLKHRAAQSAGFSQQP